MRDALAARIGASLSTADRATGEFSEFICGDSTLAVEAVCTVTGVWRAEFDVVDLEGMLWPFNVDGGGGGVRLRDVCVVGVSKGEFLAVRGGRFDNELLVLRDEMDGCEDFVARLGAGTAATFFVPLVF